jgi:hypothetical protein
MESLLQPVYELKLVNRDRLMPFLAVGSRGTSTHILLVDHREVDIIRSLIRFWRIPQYLT